MKKYFAGLIAVVLAVGTVAFTTAPSSTEKALEYYFEFDIANNDPTEANVENPAKWLLVANSNGCTPAADQRACRILVDESDTDASPSPRHLKSGTSIIAAQYTPSGVPSGVFYVTVAGDVLQKFNKQN